MKNQQAFLKNQPNVSASTNGNLIRAVVVGSVLGITFALSWGLLKPLPDLETELTPQSHGVEDRTASDSMVESAVTLELQERSAGKEFVVSDLQHELRELATALVKTYPKDVGSFHLAAQIYSELKQLDSAEELWGKCLELNPRYMGPYIGLASLQMERGRNEDAVLVLEKAEKLGGNSPEMLLKLGEAFENSGDLDKALNRLQQGTLAYPENADLWFALGRVQNQLAKPVDAEASLRKAVEIGGEKETFLFALNASLMRQHKLDDAATIRKRIAEIKQPKQFDKDTFQDRYDSALGRIASELFTSAGTIAEANKSLDEANTLYQKGQALNPQSLEPYRGLLSIARLEGRLADQELLLNKLVELDSQNLINYTNLASVAMNLQDSKTAEKALSSAMAIDPNGVLAQAASAKLYLSLRRFGRARELATLVVERQPTAAAYRLLAATYQAEGNEEQFRVAMQKADELEKSNSAGFVRQ
jgi:tetratricopeptide (TPR) repeat protein